MLKVEHCAECGKECPLNEMVVDDMGNVFCYDHSYLAADCDTDPNRHYWYDEDEY